MAFIKTFIPLVLVWLISFPIYAADDDGDGIYVIDVLVVHPNAPGDHLQTLVNWGRAWGETEMEPFLMETFNRVTQVYQNSGIQVILKMVHSQQIDLSYIDSDWKRVLSLALMNSELNNSTYTPYLGAIETIRNAHAADIVIYWRESNDDGPTANGAGSIGGGEDEAYVHLTYGGMHPAIVSHETGHLLGARHSDGMQGEALYSLDGDAPLLREYRTVMTVAYPLGHDVYKYLWRFANPDTSVVGDILCSDLTGSSQSCNFSEETPLGNGLSNAVSPITSMVPVVAGFRDGSPCQGCPVLITYGPESKPIAGVKITMTESDGTVTILTTDVNGQVTLPATTANPYTLSASFTDTGTDPVDLLDAIYILQHSGELRTLTASQLLAADVSDDGDVDLLDAIYILQHSGELRTLSPSLVFLDAATGEALSETTFSPTDTPSITVIRMGDVDQSFDPG